MISYHDYSEPDSADLNTSFRIDEIAPGMLVGHTSDPKAIGTVVEISDDKVRVLWARPPKKVFFNFPSVHQAHHTLIQVSEFIQIQPMTAPAASLFYLDYDIRNQESGSKK